MIVSNISMGAGSVAVWARPAFPQTDATSELRKELDALRGDYEKRINQLESRIRELEAQPTATTPEPGNDAPRPARKKAAAADDAAPAPRKKPERKEGDTDPEPTPEQKKIQAREFEKSKRMAADERFDRGTEIRDLAMDLNEEAALVLRATWLRSTGGYFSFQLKAPWHA